MEIKDLPSKSYNLDIDNCVYLIVRHNNTQPYGRTTTRRRKN